MIQSLSIAPLIGIFLCSAISSVCADSSCTPRVDRHEDLFECLALQAAGQGYDQTFIDLVELVYGKGFLSQGGRTSVEEMIEGLELDRKNLLDIGSGLGGPSITIAEHHRTKVFALEPNAWMRQQACRYLEESSAELQGEVNIISLPKASNLKGLNNNFFDVVFCKESLLHIPDSVKPHFFAEIFRVLRPGGVLVILDWVKGDTPYSVETLQMMELDGVAYHLIPRDRYTSYLEGAGFRGWSWEDKTSESQRHSYENVLRLRQLKGEITQRFGIKIFEESVQSWQWQQNAFHRREIQTGLIRAYKI
jgi:phosphoethanolamine N-methyltransferase